MTDDTGIYQCIATNVVNNDTQDANVTVQSQYRIVGKFGGMKVWRIDSSRAFGERKFGRSTNRLLIVITNLDGFSLVNYG